MQSFVYKFLLVAGAVVLPAIVMAADYSTNITSTTEGTFTDTVDTKKFFKKQSTVIHDGDVTLAQDETGQYLLSGSIARLGHNAILRHHYRFFESAELTMDADLPAGTSIDLYVRTTDPEGSYGVHARSKTWTKVEEGEQIDLHSFGEQYDTGLASENKLRWRAVLHTTDPDVTPTLHSVLLTYFNADQQRPQLQLMQNTFGVNRTSGATVKMTIYGIGFQEGNEEVYLKGLFTASSVEYVNSKTLVATFPITSLSAGTYTVVVRNTETSRVAVTDGLPLYYYFTEADPQHDRLLLKWFAPEIQSFSPTTVAYASGETITIKGKYFSYGTTVSIDNDSDFSDDENDDDPTLPADSVTIVNENTITVDLTSGIITQYGLDRDSDLTIVVSTPDYQTVSKGTLRID